MEMIDELFELDKKLQNVIKREFASSKHPSKVFLSGSAVEVGTLCRSLPSKIFEVEFDIMIPHGELTQEMGSKYLREVEGCPGYFHLLSSPRENI